MAETTHEHPWYVAVFVWLGVLTVIEVGVTYLPWGRFTMISVLSLLAFMKAALVALYFMHLKFERMKLFLFVLTPVVCVVLLLTALFVDAVQLMPA